MVLCVNACLKPVPPFATVGPECRRRRRTRVHTASILCARNIVDCLAQDRISIPLRKKKGISPIGVENICHYSFVVIRMRRKTDSHARIPNYVYLHCMENHHSVYNISKPEVMNCYVPPIVLSIIFTCAFEYL